MGHKVGDTVRIHDTEITGIVRSVNSYGNLGVDWADGETTPDGMIHPDDVAGIDAKGER